MVLWYCGLQKTAAEIRREITAHFFLYNLACSNNIAAMAKNKPLFDEMVVYLSTGSNFTMEAKDLGQFLSDHGALVVVNINSRVSIEY